MEIHGFPCVQLSPGARRACNSGGPGNSHGSDLEAKIEPARGNTILLLEKKVTDFPERVKKKPGTEKPPFRG